MGKYVLREVPKKPIALDEVALRFPTVRQSLLASFDDCALSALFKIKYENGWSTHPQARGTIFHRVAAECLRTMQLTDSEFIPIGSALAILEEALEQKDVPPEDIVRLPLRQLPELEMAVRKFAKDNSFTIRNIRGVERKLEYPVRYPDPDTGELIERVVTGTIDALIDRPPDEAIVLDWKDTWALPPERHEDADDPGVSYHGYFQQMLYGWLVMKTYPAVQAVTLREFYVRRTKARPARVTRADLDRMEERIVRLVKAFDSAVAAGLPPVPLRLETLVDHGHWKPSPGKHCHWCVKKRRCPLDDDYKGGDLNTPEDAKRLAAVRVQARAIDKDLTTQLHSYADLHGDIPIKSAKGRRVLGHRQLKSGKTRFEEYTPEEADRPGDQEVYAPNLEDAMKSATERAREERDAARAARRRGKKAA